jgi:hypothetical protein
MTEVADRGQPTRSQSVPIWLVFRALGKPTAIQAKEQAMSAEWAEVLVGALGVFVTVVIAVAQPIRKWLKGRTRVSQTGLQIITSRWMPNGLRLEFHYAREFLHRAATIQVTIATPGVRLIPGRPALNPAPMATGGYIRWEFNGCFIEGSGPVKLIPVDGPENLMGVMFLMPDGTGDWVLREAQIEVSVNDGDRVTKHAYSVSPIGEDPSTVFAEPVALQRITLA